MNKPFIVFSDNNEACTEYLWSINPDMHRILSESATLEDARDGLYNYLECCERKLFNSDNTMPVLEKDVIRESIKVFRNIIGPVNEKRTGTSSLHYLWKISKGNPETLNEVSPAFLYEFIHLFKAVSGKSDIYIESIDGKRMPDFIRLKGREAALHRTEALDNISRIISDYFRKYPSGLDQDIARRRNANTARILNYFNATEDDWNNYKWHLNNVIKSCEDMKALVELTEEQQQAISMALKNHIPFGITPYYLSLMEYSVKQDYDHAIRAQVIPPTDYVELMSCNTVSSLDFMGEQDTSPVELITRRYPMIAIFKPYNTCSQICVYCQRNWEIDDCMDPDAQASSESMKNAFDWLDDHPEIGEILITGGDPMVMDDDVIEYILRQISSKKHIYRIRIGTRTPVVLPHRWTDDIVDIIAEFHRPGLREIAIVTHFVHSSEITSQACNAIQKIRLKGIGVYNQEVFNRENSRRFESAKLRHDLRLIGVDPYYTFNMKGKKETRRYMVPIARLLQERKEEARLLPGLTRTDEPVFNVPKMGKNHIRAWQDHDIIMILPDGSRVYQFHPWEKNITLVPAYDYTDVPVYDYLSDLSDRGEDIDDYSTIWYYY